MTEVVAGCPLAFVFGAVSKAFVNEDWVGIRT